MNVIRWLLSSADNMDANKGQRTDIRKGPGLLDRVAAFHADESGVAATEYVTVFVLLSIGATLALISTAAYIKGFRDFMVWWFAHPAI